MRHLEFDAPDALRDSIKCFWYNHRDLGAQRSGFEVLPDGYAEIVFHFGGACSIARDGSQQELPSPFLMGLLNQPVIINAQGVFEVIAIRCFPWTVFDLLDLPSAKGGPQKFEHPIAQLHPVLSKLIAAGRVEDAVAEVQRYFLDRQLAAGGMLAKAGAAMRQAGGAIPVSEIATAAHATVRTLERKFKQSSGHTVKDVAGLMRFEQVRNHLWSHPDANIADLAHRLGYTDQSHLSREFKRYSGSTPAAFARKARQGRAALAGDFVAFVQSRPER